MDNYDAYGNYYFTAGTPKPYGNFGCRHVELRDQKDNTPLTLKLNQLDLPSFALQYYNSQQRKFKATANIPDETKNSLTAFMETLQDTAFICRQDWFPNMDLTRDQIVSLMTPIMRESKNRKRDGSAWPVTISLFVGKSMVPTVDKITPPCSLVDIEIVCNTVYINKDNHWGLKLTLETKERPQSPKRAAPSREIPTAPAKKQRPSHWAPEELAELPPMPQLARETTLQVECYGCVNNRPSQRDHAGEYGCCINE